jgi:cytochrome c556
MLEFYVYSPQSKRPWINTKLETNMKTRILALLLLSAAITSCNSAPKPEAGKPAAAGPAPMAHGNLQQVMRGIMFPNSNVIFYVQDKDPKSVKQASDPAAAVNILESAYGGWDAVENSSLALAEAANLLIIPGRKCSNGKDVPMNNEDWPKLVQGLRDAGMTAYKAAQSKNQDNILMATDAVTTACANCHEKYRDKPGGNANRCM